MTIDEAIALVDELKPNQVERARKIDWLGQLDHWIFVSLMQTHERDADVPEDFIPYTQETNPNTVLLAKAPYEELYRFFLEMHIDLVNQEYDKYNNSSALYANAWGQFSRAWHRNHKPLLTSGAWMEF